MGDNLTAINFGVDFVPMYVKCGGWGSCAVSEDFQLRCWGEIWETSSTRLIWGRDLTFHSFNVDGTMFVHSRPIMK